MNFPEIPFNRVSFDADVLTAIQQSVENGHISGSGPFSRLVEGILERIHRGSKALLTPSCSHALELSARLLDFEPGDEIIVPSFTFVTSVSSFVASGATPVFCDIDRQTLGLDFEAAKALVTSRTKAICLVHYGGVPASPERFAELADDYGLVMIEDNAHGLGGVSNGRRLGTFGALSTLSFHETKNITCGEGGALVVNDPTYFERAEILREKGTDRNRFFRGQVDKYTWQDLGSSWVLSDILAAVLHTQLVDFDSIQRRREFISARYHRELLAWSLEQGIQLHNPSHGTSHLFYLLFTSQSEQAGFIDHMSSRGVQTVFHYQPLHTSPFGSRFARCKSQLPVTDRVAATLVRLPLFPSLGTEEQDRVIEAALEYSR